jgi:hypothetical protein
MVRGGLARRLAAALALSLLFPGRVEAAFVVTDGLDRTKLRQRQVSVAVVRVTRVVTDRKRKRQGYVLHRWIGLTVVKQLYGPAPPARGLRRVPFSPWVNSAWPGVKGKLMGRHFIMAWIRGYPCGLGSTVSLGRRFDLPLLVSGPKDPMISAVRALLKSVSIPGDAKRLAAYRRAFFRGPALLSLLADGALVRFDKQHGASPGRHARLLAMIDTSKAAVPLLTWPLMTALEKFPKLRSLKAFLRWRGTHVASGRDFVTFRRRLHRRFVAISLTATAELSLRRHALLALARAPVFLGFRNDALDRRSVVHLRRQLQAKGVELRRSACRALLTMAKHFRRSDVRRARRLVRWVRAQRRQEKSAQERYYLHRMIKSHWRR